MLLLRRDTQNVFSNYHVMQPGIGKPFSNVYTFMQVMRNSLWEMYTKIVQCNYYF